MQIEQNNIPDESTRNKKTMTIIAILMAVLIIAIIAVIFLIMAMNGNKLRVIVNGVSVRVPEDTFIFTEDR